MVWRADAENVGGLYGETGSYGMVWWVWFGRERHGMVWEGLYGESWGGSKHLGRWPGGAI